MRYPLKQHLQDPVDELAMQRLGQAVEARLSSPRRPRWPLRLALAGMALATASAVFAVRRDPGPLLLSDGRAFVGVDSGDWAQEVALSDGSQIRLGTHARIETLNSSGSAFGAALTRGRAEFAVRPGGPRRWTIECGLATVEVMGTEFACEREPGHLRVSVRRGIVLVRSERIPSRARRLTAGESLELSEPLSERSSDEPPRSPSPSPPPQPSEAPTTGPTTLPTPVPTPPPKTVVTAAGRNGAAGHSAVRPAIPPSWLELARLGRNQEAFASLGPSGFEQESKGLGVDDLLALADVARLSGHPTEAVTLLNRLLAEFPNHAQASLAAFALGRLELDALAHPRAAATAFNKALALGIPVSLREDVSARLVEAYYQSGDLGAARRSATDYLATYPHGRHKRAVEGWLRRP